MKQLLGLVCVFLATGVFAQTGGMIISNPYGNINLSGPPLLSTGVQTNSSKLILQQYCNDTMLYEPGDILMDLYNPSPDLSFSFDRKVVAIYNPTNYSYYFYPSSRIPAVQTSLGRPEGVFYGGTYRNSFNPYGSSTFSQAVLNGSLNYLLKRRTP